MAQGETVTLTEPDTPVEVVFRLRYGQGAVDRLPNPGDYAAVTFGTLGRGPRGDVVARAGPDLATPALVRVQTDDQAVRVTFRIGRAGFDATADGQVMLYCQYCRADGSMATPENDKIQLGQVRLGAAPASPAP